MDRDTWRQSVLHAVRALRNPLNSAIEFSRWESSHWGDGSWTTPEKVDEHFEDACAIHRKWYADYQLALASLEETPYPRPNTWGLAEFEPQVCYVICTEANRAQMLGVGQPSGSRPRSPDDSTPVKGITLYPGNGMTVTWEEAVDAGEIMNDSVVREWESVYVDIRETERRLVELWGPFEATDDRQKPDENTYKIILTIQKELSNQAVFDALGATIAKSVSNVRKVRSFYNNGRYKL